MIPPQIERKGAEVTLECSNVSIEKEGCPGFLYVFCYGTRGQRISLPPETQAPTKRESHTQPHPTFPPTYQSLMIRQVLPATPASRSLVSSIGYSTEVESLTQVIETHENLISIIQILSYDLLCGKDSISTGHLLSVGSLVNMGTPTSENTAASLPRIKNSRTFANIGVLSIIEASAVWKAM